MDEPEISLAGTDASPSLFPGPAQEAPPFTLRQLQVFLAVVDSGSISAAASKLYVSATAVALSLTQLEKALGVRLLIRRRAHGVQLTAQGQAVVPMSRTVLARAGMLYEQFAGDGKVRGSTTVGCFPSLGPAMMPGMIQTFLQEHPEASIKFREDRLDRLEAAVMTGALDLMITYDIGLGGELEKAELTTCQVGIMLPYGHWAANASSPLDMARLAAEPFVSLDSPLSTQHAESIFQLFDAAPEVRYLSQNFETVRSMVGRGFGWSITLQRPKTEFTHEGTRVMVRDLDHTSVEQVRVVAAWRRSLPLSRTASAFVDVASVVASS